MQVVAVVLVVLVVLVVVVGQLLVQVMVVVAHDVTVGVGARLALFCAQLAVRLSRRFRRFRVALLVQRQVVGARKRLDTIIAFEGPITCVLALVARQLVRASKPRITTLDVASVGFFARVDALVRLQVRALGVHLVAAWVLAVVHAPLLQLWVIVAVALDLRCARSG